MKNRYAAVGLVVLTSLLGSASCADLNGPKNNFGVRPKEAASSPVSAKSGANRELIPDNLPCLPTSPWCGKLGIGVSAGTKWHFWGDTYLVDQPGMAPLSLWGGGSVYRGWQNLLSSQLAVLGCNAVWARACPDDDDIDASCNVESNKAVGKAYHWVGVWDSPYARNWTTSVNNSCQGPTQTNNNSGCGGDDDDDGEDPMRKAPRASLSCGGDDPFSPLGFVQIECHIEWITLEISYDDGLTWETLWEGEGFVCDLAE